VSEEKRNTINVSSTYDIDRCGFSVEDLIREKEKFLRLNPLVLPDTVRFSIDATEYYGCLDWDYYVTGYRLETDDEFNKRLEKLAVFNAKRKQAVKERAIKQKQEREAKDLAEYERLRKKFG